MLRAADSGIRQQGWHYPTAVMGYPDLLQELPNIPPLLAQGGGAREQAAAAAGTPCCLESVTDLALNHRLAQGTYSYGEDFVYNSVVGGLDPLVSQEGPQLTCHLQELSGAHCAGPRH